MDARGGVQIFLSLPAAQGRIEAADIEKAIEIASSKSPSASFDVAGLHARIKGLDQMTGLVFAKGVRWLAMIRRDEGQEVFEKACAELRQFVSTPTP